MAKFLSKHLGKLALMTAAALWASCSDAKEEKTNESTAEQAQASQSEEVKKNITSLIDGPIQEDSAKLDSVLERGDCLYGCCNIVGVPPKASKARGKIITPTENDISIENDSSDTKPFILNIVRQRIPGLRHIYLKYLNKRERNNKPSFKGTIVLKLEIGDLGTVSDVLVKSTTTDYPEFDEQIAKAVSRWKFPQAKHVGSITIQFTFQENK